jgi:hypothetical protein
MLLAVAANSADTVLKNKTGLGDLFYFTDISNLKVRIVKALSKTMT